MTVQTSTDPQADAWVELYFELPSDAEPTLMMTTGSDDICHQRRAMMRMLRDAQRESHASASGLVSSASQSGDASPDSCFSPPVMAAAVQPSPSSTVELMQNSTDWLWDWSPHSVAPPSSRQKRSAGGRKQPLSLRKGAGFLARHQAAAAAGGGMNGGGRHSLWTGTDVVISLLTHAATFIIGAASVFVLLRNHSKHRAILGH